MPVKIVRRICCAAAAILSALFLSSCGSNVRVDDSSVDTLERPVNLLEKVIREDKSGIKTREDAIRFYISKGVSLYFNTDMKLTSFDCSRPAGLTDEDMKYIVFFPEAGAVHLSDRGITDSVFYYMQDLKGLTALSLYNTSVTGKGFRYLTDKEGLIIFDFGGSPITDSGLSYLSQINFSDNVIILNLKGSNVTDEGLRYLEKFRFGKGRINLRHTSVSDSGIKHLARFKDLVEIDLHFTRVTENGGAWLKKQIPGANITWGDLKFINKE